MGLRKHAAEDLPGQKTEQRAHADGGAHSGILAYHADQPGIGDFHFHIAAQREQAAIAYPTDHDPTVRSDDLQLTEWMRTDLSPSHKRSNR